MCVQLSRTARPLVRKKAALCLLRLYRKNRDVINVDGWSVHPPRAPWLQVYLGRCRLLGRSQPCDYSMAG